MTKTSKYSTKKTELTMEAINAFKVVAATRRIILYLILALVALGYLLYSYFRFYATWGLDIFIQESLPLIAGTLVPIIGLTLLYIFHKNKTFHLHIYYNRSNTLAHGITFKYWQRFKKSAYSFKVNSKDTAEIIETLGSVVFAEKGGLPNEISE